MAVKQIHGLAQWKKFSRDMSAALSSGCEELTNFGKELMIESCDEWIKKTDSEWPHSTALANGARFGGDAAHPWYSGQLHDSVAVRVADKNRTVAVRYMPMKAEYKQHATAADAGANYNSIIGIDWAIDEVRKAR